MRETAREFLKLLNFSKNSQKIQAIDELELLLNKQKQAQIQTVDEALAGDEKAQVKAWFAVL